MKVSVELSEALQDSRLGVAGERCGLANGTALKLTLAMDVLPERKVEPAGRVRLVELR